MKPLWDWIRGPIDVVLGKVTELVDTVHTSAEEKAAAKAQLLALSTTLQVEVMKAEQSFADSQASVLKAEIQGQSWLQRNWRPLLMVTFNYIIAHNHIVAPTFNLDSVPIPEQMWTLLTVSIGGYIGGRSWEKVMGGKK